jgi:quercetin dioxygenase-like cupin family protein
MKGAIKFNEKNFKIKGNKIKSGIVELKKGESVGEHTTCDGEEILYILQGEASVEIEGQKIQVPKNHAYFINQEKIHNVTNNLDENLVYLYVVGGKTCTK